MKISPNTILIVAIMAAVGIGALGSMSYDPETMPSDGATLITVTPTPAAPTHNWSDLYRPIIADNIDAPGEHSPALNPLTHPLEGITDAQ